LPSERREDKIVDCFDDVIEHVVIELIMKKLLDAADYILVGDEYHLDKGWLASTLVNFLHCLAYLSEKSH
jgi:hypothetical protein